MKVARVQKIENGRKESHIETEFRKSVQGAH
jgi:hypothetical protein